MDISNFIDIGSAIATGKYSGSQTFISEKNIFSPVIGGNDGFFNETFRVGQASSGIHITGSGPVPNIKSGDYVAGTSGFIIDTGSAEFNNVSVRGTVVATSGNFLGDVNATHINTTSGSIGDWTIDENRIHAPLGTDGTPGKVIISSTSSFLVGGTNLYDEDSQFMKGFSVRTRGSNNTWNFNMGEVLLMSGSGEMYTGSSGDHTGYVPDTYYGINVVKQSSHTHDKELFVIAADGTDNGQENFVARIAGWSFDENEFKSSNLSGGSDGGFTTAGISINKAGYISAKNFYIDSDGEISGSAGNIGGFRIDGTKLKSNNDKIILSGSGEAELAGGNIKSDKFGNLDITDARLKISSNGFPIDAFNAATGKFVDMLRGDGNVQVVAFEDNTIVTRISQSGEVRDTFALSASQVTPDMSDRQAGDIYDANKPIFAYNTEGAPLAPLSATGKRFLTRTSRDNPIKFHIFSPFGDAEVHIASGSNNGSFPNTLVDITASQNILTEQLGTSHPPDTTEFYEITSSLPIVVSVRNTNGTADRMYVPPVSKEIFAASDLNVNQIKGTSSQTISNIGKMFYFSDSPFAVQDTGDGDGTDAEQGLPIEMLGDTYVVPHTLSDYRIVAVETGVVKVYQINNGVKTLFESYNISGSKTNPQEVESGSIAGSSTKLFSGQAARFEGTMPFFLRVNDNDKNEYPVLGYRRTQTPQYQNSTTIEGDRVKTGKIQSNNLSTTAGSEFNLNDGTFKLGGTSDPALSFDGSTLQVSGTLSSSIGNIGGFTIDGHSLTTTGVEINDSTQDLFINTSNFDVSHAGNITASNVDLTGKITATDGIFTGSISASSGEIGGFSISNKLSATNIELDPKGQSVTLGSGTATAKMSATDGIFVGSATRTTSTPFQVNLLGGITASKAIIKGTSEIAGFDISDTEISSQEGTLKLKTNGEITASSAKITGGEIGGFELTDAAIIPTDIGIDKFASISSSGDIEIGQATDLGNAPFVITNLRTTRGTINAGLQHGKFGFSVVNSAPVHWGSALQSTQTNTEVIRIDQDVCKINVFELTGSSLFVENDIRTGGNLELTASSAGNINIAGHITASGDISASGTLTVGTFSTDSMTLSNDLTVEGDINANGSIVGDGSSFLKNFQSLTDNAGTTGISYSSTDQLIFTAGSVRMFDLIEDDVQDRVVINSSNNDVDFIVETVGADNTLYVNGSMDNIGMGTSNPPADMFLTVIGDISSSGDVHVKKSLHVNTGLSSTDSNNHIIINNKIGDENGILFVSQSAPYVEDVSNFAAGIRIGLNTTSTNDDWFTYDHKMGKSIFNYTRPTGLLILNAGDGNTTAINSKMVVGNAATADAITAEPTDMLTVAGNISASGAIYGKQIHIFHHTYLEDSDHGENFIPGPGSTVESSGNPYYTKWIAPYNGEIKKVLVHFENDPGDTIVKFYKNGTGKAQQQILDASISATTTAIFDVLNTGVGAGGADRTFSVGDLLSISITPENAPGEVNVTSVWEYDMQA